MERGATRGPRAAILDWYDAMNSKLNPGQTDPRDVVRATEQIVRALNPKQTDQPHVQRATENLSKLKHGAARRTSDPQHPAGPGDRPSSRRAVRGFIGLLFAAFIGVAAIAWQSSYGGAAKQIIASWAPQLVPSSSLPLENPVQPAQPSPPAVEAAAANTAPPQPAPLAPTTPEDVAPIDAAPSPKLAELLDTMVRDLTTAKQEIEHLKVGQEQIARDEAKVAEQLKATQEQMARVIANQNLRSKISAPPPGPTSASTRKPVPTLPAPQSTAQPHASRP
jgi:hypothetical protein